MTSKRFPTPRLARLLSAAGSAFSPPAPILQPYVQPPRKLWLRALPFVVVPILLAICAIYGFLFALYVPYLIVPFAFPLALLAAVAIWALPDSERAPTRSVELLLIASFVGLVAWPRYLALTLPGLPWITVTRLAGFPLALALLLCVSTSPTFRARVANVLNVAPAIWKALAVFLIIQLATVALSAHPMSSLNRVINAQATCTAVFFAGCYVFSRPNLVTRVATAIWILAILVGLIGLLEYRVGHVPWVDYIPGFLQIEDENVTRFLRGGTRLYAGNYRVQGTFTTSLAMAEYLSYALPFVLHFAASNYRMWIRVLAGVSIPFVLFMVLLTDSRLGLVAAFLSFLSYLLFISVLRWRRRPDSVIAPAIVLAYPFVFGLAVSSIFVVGRIRARLFGGQYQASNDGRMEQITTGIPKILKQPFGNGMGEAAEVLGWFQPDGLLTIDSYWLASALDFGLVGLTAFASFFGLAIALAGRQAIAARHAPHRSDGSGEPENSFLVPITITILNFMVVKFVFADESNHMMPFMLVSMALALVWRTQQGEFRAAAEIDSPRSIRPSE